MSVRRIASSLLPCCAFIALAACAATQAPPTAPAAPSEPAGSAASAPESPAPSAAPDGDLPVAQLKTRRLSANELEGGWVLRTATDAAGARIDELFPALSADAAAAQPGGKIEATLEFDTEGRVSAYAGCNRMSGSYQAAGGRLTLDLSMMTKRGCPDPLNRADAALSERLSAGFRATILERMPLQLRLVAEDGSVYMFERVPMRL